MFPLDRAFENFHIGSLKQVILSLNKEKIELQIKISVQTALVEV